MDRDRIEGAGNKMKGDVQQAVGEATGDQKMQSEGAMDKAKGKLQNAAGSVKDALKGKD